MDTQAPSAWRSEAFAEDLPGGDAAEREARAYPWAPHALWLCALPLAVSVLGGVAAFLQMLA
jgi:hypothetical protein